MSRGQGRSGGRGRDYTAFLLDRLLSQLVVNQAAQDELRAIRRFRLRKAGHSPVPDSDAEAPGPGFWMVGSDLPPESVPPPAYRQEPLLVTRQVGQRIRDELEARVVAMELLPTHDLALSCDLLYGFVAEGLITLFSQEIEAQLLRQSVRRAQRQLHAH